MRCIFGLLSVHKFHSYSSGIGLVECRMSCISHRRVSICPTHRFRFESCKIRLNTMYINFISDTKYTCLGMGSMSCLINKSRQCTVNMFSSRLLSIGCNWILHRMQNTLHLTMTILVGNRCRSLSNCSSNQRCIHLRQTGSIQRNITHR